ncbi:MAG: glycosyltransferase family 2 protein [Opitutus sp.]|nr:glycosyltransferase family 2 protein [Opitutus sp.]
MPVSTSPLSVVIISFNEEKRIGDCLDSVRDLTDDIIVVDAHSTDRTPEICRARGARLFQRRWDGYSAQKNFGNAQARHDWILSLDADERASPELIASIRRELERGPHGDAFAIRFENYFGAQRIRFGAWNPERHVRLFHRGKLRWNDDEVHEGLSGKSPVRTGRLDGRIRHLTVDSHAHLAAKSERYSSLFADKLRRNQKTTSWWKIWLNPAWRFLRDYVARFGVLDGMAGAQIAWEAARYTHLKYRKAPLAPHPFRPLDWMTLGGGSAALALALTQLSGLTEREAIRAALDQTNDDASGQVAAIDHDDDRMDLGTLSAQDDDDVIV